MLHSPEKVKNMNFSAKNRTGLLEKLSEETLDLLIIGGGITGAGIALDAVLRGWKVGLVEKNDFASGTSSRSTKLIHGGLRYLKQFELKLVHETGTERAVIHKNAPHLVRPEDMLLPIIEGGTLGKIGTGLALWVYDKLAGVKSDEAFDMLSEKETIEAEPLLKKEGLKGGALYTEYRTDDARLTIETLKTAVSKGAICVNYTEATELIYENKKLKSVNVTDSLTGKSYTINAQVVVNAAGPWVDSLREKDHSINEKKLHLTKGVHVVVPYLRFPIRQALYFDVLEDGRMMFAIPRMDVVYIGTTDTNYQGEMHNPHVTHAEISYLLKAVNALFPSVSLSESDIVSTWAGLRPLIHEEGKSPSALSRKDEIFESPTGLISIAGGKLTGYRKMADRITSLVGAKLVEKGLIQTVLPCTTDVQALIGGDFESNEQIFHFAQKAYMDYGKLVPPLRNIMSLTHLYGTQTKTILNHALDFQEKGYSNEAALLAGELQFCLDAEMTVKLADYLIRRSGKLYFERPSIAAVLPEITAFFAAYFQWGESAKAQALEEWKVLFDGAMKWE